MCRWEAKELDRQLHLAAIDKELHDAYNSAQEAIEVKSLHEYSTLMWTKDAQARTLKTKAGPAWAVTPTKAAQLLKKLFVVYSITVDECSAPRVP